MCTSIRTLKELINVDINCDQEFNVNHLNSFFMILKSITEEVWRRKALPSTSNLPKKPKIQSVKSK
jgi:hypothetical protein